MEEENKPISFNDWMNNKTDEAPVKSTQALYHFYLVVNVNGKNKQLALTPIQSALFDVLIKSLRNSAGGFDLLVAKELPDDIFEN
jgi:hypothetical protein